MDLSNDSARSMDIFSIISLTFTSCCLLLFCCGYITHRKLDRSKSRIHFTNHPRASEAHTHIFTIEVPNTQEPTTDHVDPSCPRFPGKAPPPYGTNEDLSPAQHELDGQVS